jgi:hypothetical protein
MQGFAKYNITATLESLMVEVYEGRRKGKQDTQHCLVLFFVASILFVEQTAITPHSLARAGTMDNQSDSYSQIQEIGSFKILGVCIWVTTA